MSNVSQKQGKGLEAINSEFFSTQAPYHGPVVV